jgi:hypothetical protein
MKKKVFNGNKLFASFIAAAFAFSVSFNTFANEDIAEQPQEMETFDIIPQTTPPQPYNLDELELDEPELDDFNEDLPEDLQGAHRHLVGVILTCICSHIPSCSKKLLLNGTYLFKMLLKTMGCAFTYAGGADLISNLLDLEKTPKIWFVTSAAAIAFLQTGSDITNSLLKADKKHHPEHYQ